MSSSLLRADSGEAARWSLGERVSSTVAFPSPSPHTRTGQVVVGLVLPPVLRFVSTPRLANGRTDETIVFFASESETLGTLFWRFPFVPRGWVEKE